MMPNASWRTLSPGRRALSLARQSHSHGHRPMWRTLNFMTRRVASVGNARAKLDRQVEIFDDVLAGGFASMQCAPGRIVGKRQDVRFERVDRLAVGEAEQPVFHSDFLKVCCGTNYRRVGKNEL